MNYKTLYDKVGSVRGWDFSDIAKRTKTIGKKWDYVNLVKEYVNKETLLLDIGTGGGEILLKLLLLLKKLKELIIPRAGKNIRKEFAGVKKV